ncbi:apurinic/apyrimidinic endonuclease family protein [Pseudomonas profundi]|uniref:xylose isomerase n=1 Tax=Pseudomonas profundi TaxID=1981513 RepID=UPI0012395D37|nr:xylose isomerase [Pseudomonas profundi]
MNPPFLPPIGCNGRGVQDSCLDRPITMDEPSIEEQFKLVKRTGDFDYFDRLPLDGQLETFLSCIEKYDLPVHTTSWLYELGSDDHLIEEHMKRTAEVGSTIHNMMVYNRHANGRALTDQEIIDAYLFSYDKGMRYGVEPSFENHVNMWSEDPRRITPIAEAVERRGVPFNLTLDYSHVIFKIGNPVEQKISGICEDVASQRLILDPFEKGNLLDEWLELNIVRWLQVRCVAPNGPRNLWAPHDPDISAEAIAKQSSFELLKGEPGRGILYPFTRPAPGEWHSEWHAYNVEPTKEVVRKVLNHHLCRLDSRLRYITTEMITLPDYALNAKFSLIGQNAAIAKFIRATWKQLTFQQ